MNDEVPQQLQLPLPAYEVKGYYFGQRVRSRMFLWARHLGDDIIVPAGTEVAVIAAGKVVWSEIRKGSSSHRNWGGIVVVEHMHKTTNRPFYSLYGHMRNVKVVVGQVLEVGTVVGEVAAGLTPENGWWKIPHLHFAIYAGPWTNVILPGYKRFFDDRTRFSWWRDPRTFIAEYNQ